MKGYLYTMYQGADPGHGWTLTDPHFGETPTLGACVPNLRRSVAAGDHVFVVSGRVPLVPQFVVGGFEVSEKITAVQAYKRFPDNRLRRLPGGAVSGNVIVDAKGRHHPLDSHDSFDRRVSDYLVGCNPVVVVSRREIEMARNETLPFLRDLFERPGDTVFEVLGRWRRLNESQIMQLRQWLLDLKLRARGRSA